MKRITLNNAKCRNLLIIGDELFVCTCSRKDDSILVYTKELELVRRINIHAPGGFKEFHCMASDCRGNFYVCGRNTSIHVFTDDGHFIREFGSEILSTPCGMCVVGDYVYVTDRGNNDLLIFTTAGEHVTSLKCQCQCTFNSPYGVRADQDGFIYICDSENKRIVIF